MPELAQSGSGLPRTVSHDVRCFDFHPRSTISSLTTLAARSASVNSLACVTVAKVLSDDRQT